MLDYLNFTKHRCRLCNGTIVIKFSKLILGKYDVNYHECENCNSLQTDFPYWLDEAYSDLDYNLDTGALQRQLNNFSACFTLIKLLKVGNVVDFGSKDGLLCRFLRDHLVNCYSYDKYSRPSYTIDFQDIKMLDKIQLVTAFEVFEHFSNPQTDLDEVFNLYPDYVLISTEIYSDQGSDWNYLASEGGQHVFFYSKKSINYIAKKYKYSVTMVGGYILFYKAEVENIQEKIISIKTALNGWIFQAIKSYIFLLPTPGVQADHEVVKTKISYRNKFLK